MSATLICTEQGKRLHIGVYGEGESSRSPICGQSAMDGWYLNSAYGSLLGRRVTRICSACVREADRISGLAAGLQR